MKESDVKTGQKCPKCGADGKRHGEHETAVRNIEVARVEGIKRNIVDVGWRCWSCGHEWGFEVPLVYCPKEDKEVPVWYCLGSLTQGRELCRNLIKATVHTGGESADVECKLKGDTAG